MINRAHTLILVSVLVLAVVLSACTSSNKDAGAGDSKATEKKLSLCIYGHLEALNNKI